MDKSIGILDKDYASWVKELVKRYRSSQIKAAVKVNNEMLRFYWELGKDIKEKIAESIMSEKKLVESIGLRFREYTGRQDPARTVKDVYGGKYGEDNIGRLSRIVLCIKRNRGITIEEIAESAGMPYKEVLEYTAMLETDGIISTDLMQRCYIRLK